MNDNLSNKRPKISVVMSVYNNQNAVSDSIKSILKQSLADFEFIIIDDCSTDNSLNIIKKYGTQDKRIIVVENQKNIGLTRSLNKGLAIARGYYIARQDADDVSQPDRFTLQYNYLESHKDIFLCGSDFQYIDDHNALLGHGDPRVVIDPEMIEKKLPEVNVFIHSTWLFRNIGLKYRDKFYYAQDYDFLLTCLSSKRRLANLKEKLVLWRINQAAISFTKTRQQKLFAQQAKLFYQQRLKSEHDDYLLFDNRHIMAMPQKDDGAGQAVEDKIIICLSSNRIADAKKIYKEESNRLPFSLRRLLLKAFIHFPFVYKVYKKVRYP